MADDEGRGRYLGAYALCRDPSGRLLLARLGPGLLDEGLWTMPGGGVEWGEDPDDADLTDAETDAMMRAFFNLAGHWRLDDGESRDPAGKGLQEFVWARPREVQLRRPRA